MKVVAEVGAANGSVAYAIEAAQAAHNAGADMVKYQMYRRDTLVTRDAKTYATALEVPDTQWEDFANTIDYEDWQDVKDACDDIGIEVFWSCFDFDAVDRCEAMGVERYKVASGDITFKQLLHEIGLTGKDVYLSTGASTVAEYRQAVEWIGHDRVLPFICTLAYPTPWDQAHLDRVRFWRQEVGGEVGWSDHTTGAEALAVAKEMGAVVAEKHFTITPGAGGEGGDHDFAITPDALKQFTDGGTMVTGAQFDTLAGSYYLTPRTIEEKARTGARRALCALVDIKAGDIITADQVTFLRPGTGIPPFLLAQVVGSTAVRDYPAGTQIERGEQ